MLPIADDNGVITMEVIPNTPLVPNAAKSILSPQHFAKKYPENSAARKSCRATQFHYRCVFHWGIDNERTLTIYNDRSDVPTFYSAASINAFATFMTPATMEREDLFMLETTVLEDPILPIVSDDEDSISSNSTPTHLETHQPNFQTSSNLNDSNSSPTNSTEPLETSTTEKNSTENMIKSCR